MKISIIGAAGVVGSCIAYTLVSNNLADDILLVDTFEGGLKAHWLDLKAIGAHHGMSVHMGTYDDLGGTDIVILAAGAPTGAFKNRLDLLPASLPILKTAADNINLYAPQAMVITETNPVDPSNYAMYLLSTDKDRRRYIGYSFNDSIRFRMWSAEALGVKASQVRGTVIGEHGHSQVMLFSTLRVDGQPVKVDEKAKNEILKQPPIMLNAFETNVPRRTAGWTSAFGTAIVVRAIQNDSKASIPCNAVLVGEYGLRNISLTVPVILGKNGIEEVQEIQLSAEERQELENSVQTLMPQMKEVEKFLGITTASN